MLPELHFFETRLHLTWGLPSLSKTFLKPWSGDGQEAPALGKMETWADKLPSEQSELPTTRAMGGRPEPGQGRGATATWPLPRSISPRGAPRRAAFPSPSPALPIAPVRCPPVPESERERRTLREWTRAPRPLSVPAGTRQAHGRGWAFWELDNGRTMGVMGKPAARFYPSPGKGGRRGGSPGPLCSTRLGLPVSELRSRGPRRGRPRAPRIPRGRVSQPETLLASPGPRGWGQCPRRGGSAPRAKASINRQIKAHENLGR